MPFVDPPFNGGPLLKKKKLHEANTWPFLVKGHPNSQVESNYESAKDNESDHPIVPARWVCNMFVFKFKALLQTRPVSTGW